MIQKVKVITDYSKKTIECSVMAPESFIKWLTMLRLDFYSICPIVEGGCNEVVS